MKTLARLLVALADERLAALAPQLSSRLGQALRLAVLLLDLAMTSVQADPSVVAWGSNENVPVWLTNAVAVAAGDAHSLALLGDRLPVVTASLSDPALTADGFSVSLPTQSGRVYALEYKNSLEDATWTPLPLVAGTGHERTLTDPAARGEQRFHSVVRW